MMSSGSQKRKQQDQAVPEEDLEPDNDDGGDKKIAKENDCSSDQILVSLLLKQSVDILSELSFGDVVDYCDDKVIVKDSMRFSCLLEKSKALVNYTDAFVLRSESDKIAHVRLIGEYDKMSMEKYYGHLCFATGLLNTIVTESPKRKIPSEIKSKKAVVAFRVANVEGCGRFGLIWDSLDSLEELGSMGMKTYSEDKIESLRRYYSLD